MQIKCFFCTLESIIAFNSLFNVATLTMQLALVSLELCLQTHLPRSHVVPKDLGPVSQSHLQREFVV